MSENIIDRKLKSVTVKNFQAHTDSTFDLENGLNLIVGTSDSGKSALARAINFVLYNISESDFVREKEKFFEVEIVFADGAIIKRTKGKDINSVSYKYPTDFDFTTFKAFGNSYPDVVLDFLDRPIMSKALGAVSYSDQSNKNFLIEQPASAQPKILSTVIGTDDIQKAADNCSSKVRSFNDQVKTSESVIKNLEEKIETQYINLDEEKQILDGLQNILEQINIIETEVLLIESDLNTLKSIKKRGNENKQHLNLCNNIIEILSEKIDTLVTKSNDLLSITTIINNDKNIKERLKIAQKNLELNQAILDSSIETKIEKIQLLSSETNVISDMIDDTNNFKTKIHNYIQKIEDEKNIIETKQEELDNLYKIIHENEWYCNECNKFGGQEL
jgi:exonuclease SbcC